MVDYRNLEMDVALEVDTLHNHILLAEVCSHEEELEDDMVELVYMVGPVILRSDQDLLLLMTPKLIYMISNEPKNVYKRVHNRSD